MSEQAMDDVSKFLQDVKEMNARRTEEDDARQRELDEKIQQEKRERQARRAERARSISPQKSSPANTPPPSRGNTTQLPDDLRLSSPGLELTGSPRPRSRGSPAPDTMERVSTSPTKENDSPFDADNKRSSVTSPTGGVPGARPLSWQRRPNSQHSDRSKSRPLSVVAAENAARTSPNPTSDPSSATEQTFSREQISQALGSKDPAWFRQTADRASAVSAANRKTQVEDTDTTDMSSMRAHQLPGLSRSSSTDLYPEHSSPTKENRLGSPLSLSSAQRLDPPAEISPENDTTAQQRMPVMSSGSGRASPTRPVSPTKGMGGFVQSAMMKRSDSVKRWSVTSPPGLVRADSAASSRVGEPRSRPQSMFVRDSTATTTGSSHARSRSRPASRPSSRPTSRHSNQEHQDETETTPKAPAAAPPSEAKPDAKEEEQEKLTPPSSPSKTMDARRWSPTKASWLETALNKPEAPKPKPPSTPNQPAWMVELNKAKAQKAANPSVDLGRSGSVASNKHEVNIGGLMRSTPMGSHEAKSSVSGLKGIYTPVNTHKTGGSIGSPGIRSSTIKSPTSEDKPEETTAPVEIPKRSPITDSPAVAKVKPETPPKKDFRGGLKSRNVSGDGVSPSDPVNELQSVFGNLRRTKTQNYVAPDELKSNISRGKAALNITGGPKPSERKDEFKEAILKKKEDFKAAQSQGRGVARTKSNASESPVPEALLKRHALSKSVSGRSAATLPSAIEHRKSVSERSKSVSKDESNEPMHLPRSPLVKPPTDSLPGVHSPTEPRSTTPTLQKETSAPPARLQGRAAAGGLAGRFNPALAGLLARGPPLMAANGGRDTEKAGESSGATEPTTPGPQLTHMTKGRARGPKRKAPSSKGLSAGPPATESVNEPKPSSAGASPAREEPSRATEEPKKSLETDAPVSIQAQVAAQAAAKNRPAPFKPFGKSAEAPVEKVVEASSEKPILPAKEEEPVSKRRSRSPTMKLQSSPIKQFEEKPIEPTAQPTSPKKLDMKRVSMFFQEKNQETTKPESPGRESTKIESPSREEPKMESPKREELRRESPAATPSIKPKPVFEKAFSPPPQKTEEVAPVKTFGRPLPEPTPSPAKKSFPDKVEEPSSPARTFGRPLPDPTPRSPMRSPVRSPAPNDQMDSPHVAPLRTFGRSLSRPSSPQKSNERVDSEPVVSVRDAAAMFGGSVVQSPPLETRSRFDTPTSPAPRTSTPLGSSSRPLPNPPKPTSPTTPVSPVRSLSKSSSDVSALLDDFFGTQRPQREYRLDTTQVLLNKPRVREIQSQGARLFQITGDGKKIPVSAHNERILFEGEMYICANAFINEVGKRETEVCFWIGDEVPDATVEDAALFVSREARSLGGKVIKMRQGRETPEFIMALGGMIIVRRGTNAKYDSLAPSMLCGRRMLGQVVFDEVDFSSTSLCSGFPFLITQSGKCYLWKGRGSDVDELSCARLIGMDLSLMGELLEIDDGSEPDTFWAIFNDGTKPHSADHWRLKSNYDKYCQRLFRSDASAAQQVYEISPFTQADLDPSGIYVLDAFFEMYIIVGKMAQSQYGSFRNALEFAQEYAILASGMEDRPFIPVSTVVLEGIPKDLKSVFRKWRDEASPTIMPKKTPGLKRGRSLRVVPLTHALQAMKE